jgi:hypothetical protein
MLLNAVCDSKHGPIAFLECNIVTLFTGWIIGFVSLSRQKRVVIDFCRPAMSYEQVFIRTTTSRAPYSSSSFYTLLFASPYDKGRNNEEPAGYSVPP